MGESPEVGGVAVFLASELAPAMTGELRSRNGGNPDAVFHSRASPFVPFRNRLTRHPVVRFASRRDEPGGHDMAGDRVAEAASLFARAWLEGTTIAVFEDLGEITVSLAAA